MKTPILFLSCCLLAASCAQEKENDPPAPKPVAAFDLATSANTDVPVQVENHSTDATTYAWTWGDGATSDTQSPSHVFEAVGNFRVKLQTTGPGGTDTLSKVIRIAYGGVPTGLLSKVAGTYTGRYYYNYSALGGFPGFPSVSRSFYRDTILTLTAVNATTVGMLGRDMQYSSSNASANPPRWRGHAPLRANYLFTNGATSTNEAILQAAKNNDSIYVYSRIGGLGAGETKQFYGKKRP